ncbi:hypothetical protein N7453_007826 [Penicillium expansum]|nr:hypothetical protein N7453_007826 [Penicillium expansum]
MSLLVPCPGLPCILVFMVIPDWADEFDIYNFDFETGPLFFFLLFSYDIGAGRYMALFIL